MNPSHKQQHEHGSGTAKPMGQGIEEYHFTKIYLTIKLII
jgi:hypothetical protein